jgi:hypothetical protein
MEGSGSYNLRARIPAGGAELALPLLKQAHVRALIGLGTQRWEESGIRR